MLAGEVFAAVPGGESIVVAALLLCPSRPTVVGSDGVVSARGVIGSLYRSTAVGADVLAACIMFSAGGAVDSGTAFSFTLRTIVDTSREKDKALRTSTTIISIFTIRRRSWDALGGVGKGLELKISSLLSMKCRDMFPTLSSLCAVKRTGGLRDRHCEAERDVISSYASCADNVSREREK